MYELFNSRPFFQNGLLFWECMVGKHWTFAIIIAGALVAGAAIWHICATPRVAVYFTPGTDCEDHIIAEINHAKTIDIAVYAITNERIVNAIISAHNRGAKIRIITDRTMSRNQTSRIGELVSAGIPVMTHRQHKIEHNKFAIFDN